MTARLLQSAKPIGKPYNARTRLRLATPDGSGATIHPSVVDMGTPWNGYRYWLADTPYAGGDNQLENPCVWASNNRVSWIVPTGVTNPLAAPPGSQVGFHSDTELVYDPDGSRMILFYRTALFTSGSVSSIDLRALTSTNGVTWTNQGKVADLLVVGARLSPAIVRTGANAWRMWLWGGADGTLAMRTATNPLGPWDAPVDCTLGGGSLTGWHGDVIQVGSKYYMAYSNNELTEMRVATSTDGLAWTAPPTSPLLVNTSSVNHGWDLSIYRPTLVNGPEAGHVSVWYSSVSSPSPGGHAIGFTRIPLSAWG